MEPATTLTRAPSDILRQSYVGTRQWLIREWNARVSDPKLEVIFATRYSAERVIDMLGDRDPNTPLPLPRAILVPVQFGKGMDRYNSFALSKLGLHTGFIGNRTSERREKVIPIDVGIGVRFVCSDAWEAVEFSRIWTENLPDANIRIYQNSTGFTFNAKLLPDPGSIDIPQDDSSEDQNLNVQTTLILKTFGGTTEVNRLIRKIEYDFKSKPGSESNQAVVNYGSSLTDGYHLDKAAAWKVPHD